MKFKEKAYSNYVKDCTLGGLGVGASVGTLIASGAPGKIGKVLPKFGSHDINKSYNDMNSESSGAGGSVGSNKATLQQKLAIVGSCAIVGGLLGFIIGSVKKINESGSRSFAGSDRFYRSLLELLKSESLVEGLDFTLDPKTADRLKTRVCIVVSGDSSEFKLGISCKNDPKLDNTTNKVLSRYTVKRNNINKDRSQNRFNDVSISTLVNRDDNLKTVVDIVKGFVKEGYPVYIVDVSN